MFIDNVCVCVCDNDTYLVRVVHFFHYVVSFPRRLNNLQSEKAIKKKETGYVTK